MHRKKAQVINFEILKIEILGAVLIEFFLMNNSSKQKKILDKNTLQTEAAQLSQVNTYLDSFLEVTAKNSIYVIMYQADYNKSPSIPLTTSRSRLVEDNKHVYNDFSEKYKVREKYPEVIEPKHKMIAELQVPGTFYCTDLIIYAQKYLGTGYTQSGTLLSSDSPERAQKKICETQCSSFFTSIFFYGISTEFRYSLTSNYGKDKCNARGIHQKFMDSSNLKPRDIFTSSDKKNSEEHTGIFIVVEKVENLFTVKSSCYKDFIPNPTGKPVFIHSMRPVCYSTLNDLTVKQIKTTYANCRVNGC